MRRLGILLIVVILGLVLACGSQEPKAPAKPVASPEKAEKAAPQAPLAQAARMEIHSFQSMTLTDQEFLTGRKEGKAVTLAGELRLPRPGNDRLPAVVILHGSGGVGGFILDWEQYLNSMGVATFVLDSFTGRGIVNTLFDQSQLGRTPMIVDAYRAFEVLARHPRIDPQRIALMGFSSGGQAALYASLKRFQRLHGPVGQGFAAYIVFYPVCNITFRDDEDVADKPIRIFHGSADDFVPVAPCRAYVKRLKAKGKDVQLTEYAGAGHVFDGRAFKKPLRLEKAQTTSLCELVETGDGVIINVETKQPFTYADPCVKHGLTITYNEKAANEARKAVKDFVTATLKP
jgi:dienelactone hydrolase